MIQRFGIENEIWFELAKSGLERRGFRLRVQPRSIVVEKEQRLPRLMSSAREFLEFAERQGLRIDQHAFAEADRYGDGRSDLSGRASASPFETPPEDYVAAPQRRFETAIAEARRPEAAAVETRLVELRQEQERQAAEHLAVQSLAQEKAELEERYSALEERYLHLEAEQRRLARLLSETEKQRDLYQLSASAAEDRLRDLQIEYETVPLAKGNDKRFDQLRRFLARELHPDLARADTPERAVREALFKRVWAKIEQLQ